MHVMGVRSAPILGLLLLLASFLAADGQLFGRRAATPPPPAAELADAVLGTAEATASALAEEGSRTAVVYKDLQGAVVDASDGITNAVNA
jgi:hypothetical protein